MKKSVNVYDMVTDRIIEELSKGIIPWEKPWTGTRAEAYNRISKKPYSIINQMLLKHSVEGVEPLTEPFTEVQPIEAGDKLITDYITREKIHFNEQVSNNAYYQPSTDSIVVPMKQQFQVVNEYYSTTFHEITHSTGHKTRLDRLQTGQIAAFGSEEYSKEELVAEIGSATLMNLLGIETVKTFRNTTAYIQSWLNVLKNDNKFIVSASSKAEKAVNFIIGE